VDLERRRLYVKTAECLPCEVARKKMPMNERLSTDRSGLIRAAGYAYDITAHSFTFVAVPKRPSRALREGRHPGSAYGSNQSPFASCGRNTEPIMRRSLSSGHGWPIMTLSISAFFELRVAAGGMRHVPGTRVAVA